MVAYFFPPEGNAGTYRPLRFARSLSKQGWTIRVISVDPYHYERYDPQLLTLIPSEVEVTRVKGRDIWLALQAKRTQSVLSDQSKASPEEREKKYAAQHTTFRSHVRDVVRKLEACYYLPDMAKPWIYPAVNAIVRTCEVKPPRVIWATVGPVSAGMVAQQASEHVGAPYVLDFRDPWGLNYYPTENIRPQYAKHTEHRMMYRILERAQAVVFLFDTIAECYSRVYKGALDPAKIHIIPNGYEGLLEKFQAPTGEKCIILYAGTLSTYRYDTLLCGLKTLKDSHPFLAKQLRLVFVGDGNSQILKQAEQLNLSGMIEIRGTIPYNEILSLQKTSHAFLILGRESNRKGHELVAGAKLFGYLQARRPIIAVLPNDETKKILRQVGVSTIANVENPLEITGVFRRVLEAWVEKNLDALLPDQAACEVYSAERQTFALIHALEGQSPIVSFTPGQVDVPPSFKKEIGE